MNTTVNQPEFVLYYTGNQPCNPGHACLRSHQSLISATPTIVIHCCLLDTIQCSTFIPGHSTHKMNNFMETSLLQQTKIVPTILASYRWAQMCASLISCMSYRIYSKIHLAICETKQLRFAEI